MESRSSRQVCVTSDGGVHVRIFLFARDVCLMSRTKFGSDTMLNISIDGMCYTMLNMLEWMRKEKHKIGTP